MPDVRTSVYIIASGEHVKIGFARDPYKRLKNIRIGSPEGGELFYVREFPTRDAARYAERYCHRKLWKLRSSGEWFRCSPHAARAILSKARIPSRAELIGKDGKGWREPSEQECRAVVEAAFDGILGRSL